MSCRTWEHVQPESDTSDTQEEHDTGGEGYFSHGSTCLSHQHWKEQVISSGSFNLHDTEGAEAAHKISMRLASGRVRHFQVNKTQSNMQEYLCKHTVFEALVKTIPALNRTSRPVVIKTGVQLPLLERIPGGGTYEVEMGTDLAAVDTQKRFLHPEVRVARVEIMDLVCDKLGLTKTRKSYTALGNLRWSFGQVLVCVEIWCFSWCQNRVFQLVSKSGVSVGVKIGCFSWY